MIKIVCKEPGCVAGEGRVRQPGSFLSTGRMVVGGSDPDNGIIREGGRGSQNIPRRMS